MDRKLVVGAVLLLFLEIIFLAVDLGTGPNFIGTPKSNTQQIEIGEVRRAENQVRRRAQSSLVWNPAQSEDTVFEYDSVLTLQDSTAAIQLKGDTNLSLDENTLVVLEPSDQGSGGSIRIRFAKGNLRAKNPLQPLELQTSTWTVDAVKGTELSLVGLDNGKFEIELQSGAAKLKGPEGELQVAPGERVRLNETALESKTSVSKAIQWQPKAIRRVYARQFPFEIDLPWDGSAESLEVVSPEKEVSHVPVSGRKSARLPASQGTYVFRLQSANEVSQALTVQVRQAPVIRYFAPLPRDRARTSTEILFSWEPVPGLPSYRLELGSNFEFNGDVRRLETKASQMSAEFKDAGTYHWRVVGIDEDGFEIPAPRVYPLYITPDPLEAPSLHTPEIREPANSEPEERAKDGASWLLDFLFPLARAQSASRLQALFTWGTVPDADHYVIEISKTPGFEETLVNQRVKEPKFRWGGFKIGNYFWRVAAGRSASKDRPEQLGFFSSPALARLDPALAESGKGVVLLAPSEPESKSSVATPSVLAPAEKVGPPWPPPSIASTAESAEVDTAASGSGSDESQIGDREWMKHADPRQFSWRLMGSPRYSQVKSKTATNTNGSFEGPVPLSLDAEFTVLAKPQRRFEAALSYQETEWKPTKSPSPFQAGLKERRFTADVHYRPTARIWALGVATESLSEFARTAPEVGAFKTKWLFGPSLRLLWLGSASELDLRLSGRFGSGWNGGRISLAWNYGGWKNDHLRAWAGPFLSGAQLSGTSSSWQELSLGLRIGIGF